MRSWVIVMLAHEREGVLIEKAASTTYLHPTSRIAFFRN
jgi:hypothetical protein